MLRVSVIPYVNALPLVHYLPTVHSGIQMVQARPSEALNRLEHTDVDLALVPVVDWLSRQDLVRIPGLGICAQGPVTSVLIQSKDSIDAVRTIQMDPWSRTSNCLSRVLCRNHWHISPQFVGIDQPSQARVVIGDPALTARSATYTYDLSDHWTQMTGLPFVFAVWVCLKGRSNMPELTDLVHGAYHHALKNLPVLVAESAGRLKLSPAICEDYLTKRLHYSVGAKEELAMKRFKQYINELSLEGRECLSLNGAEMQGDRPYVKAC